MKPIKPLPRIWSVLASALSAGLMLAVAGCGGHITPLGPSSAATFPPAHQLRSSIVLQPMRVRASSQTGSCPAGYVALAAGPGQCYRKFGTPMTITSAGVSAVSAAPSAGPAQYGFWITLPVAEVAALTSITTTAHNAKGALAISVAGKTWSLPMVLEPFTGRQFEISLPSKAQNLELHSLLVGAS